MGHPRASRHRNTADRRRGFSSDFFESQWPNLQNRMVDHTQKADFVPVDVSGFSSSQAQRVEQFVAELGDPGVFVVGGGG